MRQGVTKAQISKEKTVQGIDRPPLLSLYLLLFYSLIGGNVRQLKQNSPPKFCSHISKGTIFITTFVYSIM